MKEKEIYDCLIALEKSDKAYDTVIDENKLSILKDLHLVKFRRFVSWELREQEITTEWKIYLSNYDNSASKKLDNYLWRYPNISKLWYFIIWTIIWLVPFVLNKI